MIFQDSCRKNHAAFFKFSRVSLSGSDSKNIMQSTQHIVDAIGANRPALLHWIGKCDPEENKANGRGSRNWYQEKPSCTSEDFNNYKKKYPDKEPQCDEYPPYAVAEGGKSGDAALKELIGVGVSITGVRVNINFSYTLSIHCSLTPGKANGETLASMSRWNSAACHPTWQ